jgi:hypothetical protein
LFQIQPAVSAPGCSLKQYASMHVGYTADGSPEVQVILNGQKIWMLLNTEAAFNVIDADVARALHISTQQIPPNSVHFGKQEVNAYGSVAMTLGHLAYPHAELLIVHLPAASMQGAAGALGFNTLAGPEVDAELDLGHDRIALFSSQHCKGMRPYWANRYAAVPVHRGGLGEYYFDMTLNGKKLQTILSTGTTDSALFTDVSKHLYDFDEHSPGVEVQSNGPRAVMKYYRAMGLSAEGLKVVNARILLLHHDGCYVSTDAEGAAAFDNCQGAHPLELGLSVLKKLRIYFAPRQGFMYFTGTDAQGDASSAEP